MDIHHYKTSEFYNQRERLALTYADMITISTEDVDDALFEKLSDNYSPEEIVELTFTIAYENMLSRLHHALLVESQGFCLVALHPPDQIR